MSINSNACAIVTQAREWLGTPFHHQARLKGKGCDCLGLVVGVTQELGLTHCDGRLLSSFDETNYPHQPNAQYLLQRLQTILSEVPKEVIRPGDLGLFSIYGHTQHIGILSDYNGGLGLIHAYAPARKVVEHRLDRQWHTRLVRAFRWQP